MLTNFEADSPNHNTGPKTLILPVTWVSLIKGHLNKKGLTRIFLSIKKNISQIGHPEYPWTKSTRISLTKVNLSQLQVEYPSRMSTILSFKKVNLDIPPKGKPEYLSKRSSSKKFFLEIYIHQKDQPDWYPGFKKVNLGWISTVIFLFLKRSTWISITWKGQPEYPSKRPTCISLKRSIWISFKKVNLNILQKGQPEYPSTRPTWIYIYIK